ncbi:MAG: hypothetical protein Q7S04_00995 [Candidatus Moranbacteria bacterium]|nr:hypothetical protein [Candidatus Moranbacteria bacterium]
MPKNKKHFFLLIFFSVFTFASFLEASPAQAQSCSDGSDTGACSAVCASGTDIPGATGCTDPTKMECCSGGTVTPPTTTPSTSAGGMKYVLLEKIPGLTNADGSDLPKYIKAIYSTGLVVIVLSALFMLSVGGFMYLTSAGNTSAMGTAKEVIFDSIIGLVIALSAWLLLNVINPDLVNVTINGLSATPITLPGAPAPVTPVPTAGQYTDAQARTALGSIQVTSSGNCNRQNDPKCTSLEGIPISTINNIKRLQTQSGCTPFTVTGGTEIGHASHGSGKPIVDVGKTSCLYTFLQNNKASGTLTSGSNISAICATSSDQAVAFNCTYREPVPHFHIQFTP